MTAKKTIPPAQYVALREAVAAMNKALETIRMAYHAFPMMIEREDPNRPGEGRTWSSAPMIYAHTFRIHPSIVSEADSEPVIKEDSQ